MAIRKQMLGFANRTWEVPQYFYLLGAIVFVAALLVTATSLAAARDASRFYDAELLEDGRTVLFTYTRAEYRVKSSSLINFGGGKAHYTRDRKYIGLYHIDRRETEVLQSISRGDDAGGRENFVISGTRGRKAMMQQQDTGQRYILDVDRGTMNPIQIKQEIINLGMVEQGTVWLAHQDGSIVVRAYSKGQKEGQKNSVPLGHIWLRRLNGQYRQLARLGSYSGTVDDEVLYYDHESRESRVYNLLTGDGRVLSNRELADMKLYNTNYGKPNQDVYVSPERDGKNLKLGRKIDARFHYEPFPIDMKPLR